MDIRSANVQENFNSYTNPEYRRCHRPGNPLHLCKRSTDAYLKSLTPLLSLVVSPPDSMAAAGGTVHRQLKPIPLLLGTLGAFEALDSLLKP